MTYFALKYLLAWAIGETDARKAKAAAIISERIGGGIIINEHEVKRLLELV